MNRLSLILQEMFDLVSLQVVELLDNKQIYIKSDAKESIKKLKSSHKIATEAMKAVFTMHFLMRATVEGSLEGKQGLPKEGLKAILGKFENGFLKSFNSHDFLFNFYENLLPLKAQQRKLKEANFHYIISMIKNAKVILYHMRHCYRNSG